MNLFFANTSLCYYFLFETAYVPHTLFLLSLNARIDSSSSDSLSAASHSSDRAEMKRAAVKTEKRQTGEAATALTRTRF